MKLSSKQKAETGAFYTPKHWADLAVKYMKACLPRDLKYYEFYDPFAGEGALLEALPQDVLKYGTTLEIEDVKILENKGFQAWQHNFFASDVRTLLPWLGTEDTKNLVVFTNPPYIKFKKNEYEQAKKIFPEARDDAEALAMLYIAEYLEPVLIVSFDKLHFLQAPTMQKFRKRIGKNYILARIFITPSFSWDGLKGKFPIGCYCWINRWNYEIYDWNYPIIYFYKKWEKFCENKKYYNCYNVMKITEMNFINIFDFELF